MGVLPWAPMAPLAAVPALCLGLLAAAGSRTEARPAKPKLVVLDMKALGASPEVAAHVTEEVALAARDTGLFEVVTYSDVREMLSFDRQKALLGCQESEKVQCYTDTLGALGARQIIAGSVGKVSDTFIVNLKLLDLGQARTANQANADVRDESQLLESTRRAAFALLDAPYVASTRVVQDVWKQQLLLFGGWQSLPGPGLEGGLGLHLAHGYRTWIFALGAEAAYQRGTHVTSYGGFPGQSVPDERLAFTAWRVGVRAAVHPLGPGIVDPFVAASLGYQASVFGAGSGATTAQPVSDTLHGAYGALALGTLVFPRSRVAVALEAGYALATPVTVPTKHFDPFMFGPKDTSELHSPGGLFAAAGVRLAF